MSSCAYDEICTFSCMKSGHWQQCYTKAAHPVSRSNQISNNRNSLPFSRLLARSMYLTLCASLGLPLVEVIAHCQWPPQIVVLDSTRCLNSSISHLMFPDHLHHIDQYTTTATTTSKQYAFFPPNLAKWHSLLHLYQHSCVRSLIIFKCYSKLLKIRLNGKWVPPQALHAKEWQSHKNAICFIAKASN